MAEIFDFIVYKTRDGYTFFEDYAMEKDFRDPITFSWKDIVGEYPCHEETLPEGNYIVCYYVAKNSGLEHHVDFHITKDQIVSNVIRGKYRFGATYFLDPIQNRKEIEQQIMREKHISDMIQMVQHLNEVFLDLGKRVIARFEIMDKSEYSDFKVEYHHLLDGEYYIIFAVEDDPRNGSWRDVYFVNVTGDSVLCALYEAAKLAMDKF